MRTRTARQSGFTLIELLVVLVIIGFGWFSLLPRLDFSRPEDAGPLTSLNDFLNEAKAQAVSSFRPQVLTLSPGSDVILWQGHEKKLPAEVLTALVNGYSPSGTVYRFKVYPEGSMDAVSIRLADDTVYRADVLRANFEAGTVADVAPPDLIDTLRGFGDGE